MPIAAGKASPVSTLATFDASMPVNSMMAAPHVNATGVASSCVKKTTGDCCFLQSQTVHSPQGRHIRVHREEERYQSEDNGSHLSLQVLT